jgi:hypothetical protein
MCDYCKERPIEDEDNDEERGRANINILSSDLSSNQFHYRSTQSQTSQGSQSGYTYQYNSKTICVYKSSENMYYISRGPQSLTFKNQVLQLHTESNPVRKPNRRSHYTSSQYHQNHYHLLPTHPSMPVPGLQGPAGSPNLRLRRSHINSLGANQNGVASIHTIKRTCRATKGADL